MDAAEKVMSQKDIEDYQTLHVAKFDDCMNQLKNLCVGSLIDYEGMNTGLLKTVSEMHDLFTATKDRFNIPELQLIELVIYLHRVKSASLYIRSNVAEFHLELEKAKLEYGAKLPDQKEES